MIDITCRIFNQILIKNTILIEAIILLSLLQVAAAIGNKNIGEDFIMTVLIQLPPVSVLLIPPVCIVIWEGPEIEPLIFGNVSESDGTFKHFKEGLKNKANAFNW